MRKIKIIDELDFDRLVVHSSEFQAAVNRMFKEVAEEGGSIVKTEYLRNNAGRLKTAIVEYEINDEEGV